MDSDFSHILKMFIQKAKLWINELIDRTPNIIIAIIVFLFGFYVARLIRRAIVRLLSSRQVKPSARNMIGNILSIFIVLVFFLIGLNVLDLDKMVKTLLAGAGVAGLAIGLALQGTLSNTFSGIALSFVEDIRIGDQVETNGFTGVVEDINLRVVKLRTTDDNLVVIPNKLIIENPLKNFSASAITRIVLSCGVSYDADLLKVKNTVINILNEKIPGIIAAEPIIFTYNEFADSSINFEVRFSAPSKNITETALIKSEAIIAIKQAFDQQSINIPYPIRTLDIPDNAFQNG